MSAQTFATLKNYYARTVAIDDADGNVVDLPICVRRFTLEQMQEFSKGWKRCENRAADRLIQRKPDGDEQEKESFMFKGQTIEIFKVPDSEIRVRRLREMTDDERAAFEAIDAEEEKFISDFYASTIRDHVWVKPGVRLVLEEDDGAPSELKTGADLARAFAGQQHLLAAMAVAVQQENTLSADEKKRLRSLSALTRSLENARPIADGGKPDATAARVEHEASAASAPATETSAPLPSGLTETSSSTPVPS